MIETRATAAWLAALALAGCELFAYADRDRIPHGAGGDGGANGSGGDDVGAAGGKAPVECFHAFDCPGRDSHSTRRPCAGGRCGRAPPPAGTPTPMQMAFDCM